MDKVRSLDHVGQTHQDMMEGQLVHGKMTILVGASERGLGRSVG
jgi:hypothetical protein